MVDGVESVLMMPANIYYVGFSMWGPGGGWVPMSLDEARHIVHESDGVACEAWVEWVHKLSKVELAPDQGGDASGFDATCTLNPSISTTWCVSPSLLLFCTTTQSDLCADTRSPER
eukprot:COSAG04_NODE_3192_length_3065_cov_21.232558_4_plen_116_part_00